MLFLNTPLKQFLRDSNKAKTSGQHLPTGCGNPLMPVIWISKLRKRTGTPQALFPVSETAGCIVPAPCLQLTSSPRGVSRWSWRPNSLVLRCPITDSIYLMYFSYLTSVVIWALSSSHAFTHLKNSNATELSYYQSVEVQRPLCILWNRLQWKCINSKKLMQ